jgi:hypothetical protein
MWTKYPRQMLRSRVISEGVRTVFPGATSGLYVPEEVGSFTEVTDTPRLEHHDAETGEIIEHHSGPAPRTKLDGPHTSKTALKQAIHALDGKVRSAASCGEIDAILKDGKATIKQAERDWPELLNGNPEREEEIGLKGLVANRRAELSNDGQFSMLVQSMKQTETKLALSSWYAANESMIETLDDADRRKFDLAFGLHESAIIGMDTVSAGA